MTNIWVIADTHFGHRNILNFKRYDGSLIRGAVFKTIEEHDETIVENWNRVVGVADHVYHLGDVVINRRSLSIIKRLNGHKRLVLGNHDIFSAEEYLEAGFEKLYGARVWPKHNLLFSHIPVHPESLKLRSWKNIHGHLHTSRVLRDGAPDPAYECVSCEHLNYTPKLVMK